MTPELGLRLAIALEQFWVTNDPFEGVRRLAALLERGSDVSPLLHARALRVYGESTWISGDFEAGTRLMEQALAVFERLEDRRAVAVMLLRLGRSADGGGSAGARRLVEESLAMCLTWPNPKLEAMPSRTRLDRARRGERRACARALRAEREALRADRLHLDSGGLPARHRRAVVRPWAARSR